MSFPAAASRMSFPPGCLERDVKGRGGQLVKVPIVRFDAFFLFFSTRKKELSKEERRTNLSRKVVRS